MQTLSWGNAQLYPIFSQQRCAWAEGLFLLPWKGSLSRRLEEPRAKEVQLFPSSKKGCFCPISLSACGRDGSEALINHWSLSKQARALQCDPQSSNHNSGNSNQLYSLLRYLLKQKQSTENQRRAGDRQGLFDSAAREIWMAYREAWLYRKQPALPQC